MNYWHCKEGDSNSRMLKTPAKKLWKLKPQNYTGDFTQIIEFCWGKTYKFESQSHSSCQNLRDFWLKGWHQYVKLKLKIQIPANTFVFFFLPKLGPISKPALACKLCFNAKHNYDEYLMTSLMNSTEWRKIMFRYFWLDSLIVYLTPYNRGYCFKYMLNICQILAKGGNFIDTKSLLACKYAPLIGQIKPSYA